MRAIMVSVDYADLLRLTLPYNRAHFDEVMVVTSARDEATIEVARANDANVFTTELFWADGAIFNKFRALEAGLDALGRSGWFCIMDADVLWPKSIAWTRQACGTLWTPRRRMWAEWPTRPHWMAQDIPWERDWSRFPLHPQQREWAGYTQIFSADDPHLGEPPWHETNWRHAGGANSFFQAKWPDECKIRPAFEVLHLGPAGRNWCGRATMMADGTMPDGAAEKSGQVRQFIRGRGKGETRFDAEKMRQP